jgi:hypothetical protein
VKFVALGVLALLLPACSDRQGRKFDITVSNQGVHAARVEITSDYGDDDNRTTLHGTDSVAAGTSETYDFRFDDIHSVRVEIFNAGNNAKIFDSTWYDNDIDASNDHLSISVAP